MENAFTAFINNISILTNALLKLNDVLVNISELVNCILIN